MASSSEITAEFLEEPLPDGDIRILSMDGGGIYGYVTALMLRRLCEENEHFLEPGSVWMFAGTSAGALNALVLASHENPREVVLSGTLERFWHRRGTFANAVNPWAAYLSWFGITAWLGAADYEEMLTEIYGDTTLGDLPHRILITAFNWSGVGRQELAWRPKVFVNFPQEDPDRSLLIRRVAYAAAAPPGLRAVVNGFGDGGETDPDPSMAAVTEVLKKVRRDRRRAGLPAEERLEEDQIELGVLARIHLLSLGVCTKPGLYGLHNFDFGSLLFNLLPTNPARGQWYPPAVQVTLDGPTEVAVHQSEVFLEERFHRLDPPLLGPPEEPTTLVATAWARFPMWQAYLLERQRLAMQTLLAKRAVNRALRYLEHDWELAALPPAAEPPAAAAATKPRRSEKS